MKHHRTGICYTNLLLSSSFKGPKVWSTTRMCLYEFDMVLRFIQNRDYFDVKGDVIILSILYCVVMFSLKILLKQCQKTDVSSNFVNESIVCKNNAGQKTMKLCLHAAESNLLYNSLCLDPTHTCISIKCKEPYKGNNKFPDILSSGCDDKEFKENNFINNLKHFFEKNNDFLSLPLDFESLIRDTRGKQGSEEIIKTQSNYVNNFIVAFWKEVETRVKVAGLDAGSTSYSEAPAEGVFSIVERVLGNRECLSIEYVDALQE